MKTPLVLLLLASFILWAGGTAGGKSTGPTDPPGSTNALWPLDSTIKVHFIANSFSPAQKELLWQGITDWTRRAQRSAFSIPAFVDAGETNGLIDCVNCLTVTLQKLQTNNFSSRASFNYLRRDQNGRFISAWIGIDAEVKDVKIRELLIRALDRGFGGAK